MSSPDKGIDSYASIFASIDNIAKMFVDFYSSKKKDSITAAKKLDKMIQVIKKRDEFRSMSYSNLTEDQKNKIAEEKQKADDEFANSEIDTETIMNGIFASPSGHDFDYLITSSSFLRQKISEKNKELTLMKIQDLRDALLIRTAEDAKSWESELKRTLVGTISIAQNISMGFMKSKGKGEEEPQDQSDLEELKTKIEDKSKKYGLE